MPTLDTVHTLIAIATSFLMCVVVWWKVSKDAEATKTTLKLHTAEIAELKIGKTDVAVTQKMITAIEKIEHDLIAHHTDFRMHRTEDSERRMTDLVSAMNELSKENRADHQLIMNKLGKLEHLDKKD